MTTCPFAVRVSLPGDTGEYTGGPFKIVHHTTEGPTAESAFAAFRKNRSKPHFTVDATQVYQHLDTMNFARALKNPPGGVETNRDSAVQIEVVGFAHLPKGAATMANVARLCRWIESQHGVPRIWPNGPPKPAVDGRDPGDHNRDAKTWDEHGGHYGHCHVPENDHWDPGYTAAEVLYVMNAEFDAELAPLLAKQLPQLTELDASAYMQAVSTMPDHSEVDRQGDTEGSLATDSEGRLDKNEEKTMATSDLEKAWHGLKFTLHYGWITVGRLFEKPNRSPGTCTFEVFADQNAGGKNRVRLIFNAGDMRSLWAGTTFDFVAGKTPALSKRLPRWVDEIETGDLYVKYLKNLIAELQTKACTLERIEALVDKQFLVRGVYMPQCVETSSGNYADIFVFAAEDPGGGQTPDGGATGPPPPP